VKIDFDLSLRPVAKTLSNLVEMFESLTTSFWTMDTSLFSGQLGAFDELWHTFIPLNFEESPYGARIFLPRAIYENDFLEK
jgi:hypothetical protein